METMFTFIEARAFERMLPYYLDDDEYAEFQQYMVDHPDAGDVIPGSGGVRKLRWKMAGTGKGGGVRVIYFVRYKPDELWMLAIYAKARQENMPAHIAGQLREEFENE
jgi:hypothetical protein